MRALALAAVVLSACAMPEDQFVLEGTVTDDLRAPVAGEEVRLLREQSRDGLRCVPMVLVSSAVTGAQGRYRFELIRQQLTMGAPQNRFFRVEVGEPGVHTSAFVFRFPSVDLSLPPLPLPTGAVDGLPGAGKLSEVETFVDGFMAWRGGGAAGGDRESMSRAVDRQADVLTVTRDSLGGTEEVPLEWRLEGPLVPQPALGETPASRGGACDVGPAGGACPLTDGRYLPFVFAPGTKTATLTLPEAVSLGAVALHGLVLGGEAVSARVEVSFDDVTPVTPFMRFGLSPGDQRLAATSCEEPGQFLALPVDVPLLRPKRVRLRFVGADDLDVELRSLSEVSVYTR